MLQNDINEIKPHRIEYIDALRTAACFTVVLLHVSAYNTYNVEFGTREWNIFMAYESIVNWAVPVFVMLSGSLMLSRNCDYPKIKKKLIRLATVFFSWSFIYIIHGLILNSWEDLSGRFLLSQFLQGHYHMWYLIMFAGLYLIAPLLRQITKDDKSAGAFLVLAIVFGCLLPSLNDLYQLCSGIKAAAVLGFLYQAAINIKEDFNFHFVLGYPLYFVTGYMIIKKISINRTSLLTGAALFIAGTVLLFTEIRCSGSKEIALLFIRYYQAGVLLQSSGAVMCAKALENTGFVRKLAVLAPYSLGIYMVHPLIMETMQKLGIDSMTCEPVWFTLALAVAVYAVSAVISKIILATPMKIMISL